MKTESKIKQENCRKFILSEIEKHGAFENKWDGNWIYAIVINRMIKAKEIKLGEMSYHENRLYIQA